MVAILEAVSGPVAGRRVEVRAGTILRIGRTAKSDYAIGEDSYLSGQHFAVECDGTQVRIRDLGSSNGTFVNGSRITDQVVREGDSVVAGGSTFTVHIDSLAPVTGVGALSGATVATPIVGIGTRLDRTTVEFAAPAPAGIWTGFSRGQVALLNTLYAQDEPVFAILDASRDSRIPAFLDASGESYAPLDPMGRAPAFAVALPKDARLLDVLIKDGWGRGWGFYGTSPRGFDDLAAHFGNLVNLHTQTGSAITFRFWDPRVLRALVPLMSPTEAEVFFGPLARIVVEAEKPEMALEFAMTPRGPRQQTVVLA
jgi:Domain of unknown function (DUF4123)/FHA domain